MRGEKGIEHIQRLREVSAAFNRKVPANGERKEPFLGEGAGKANV